MSDADAPLHAMRVGYSEQPLLEDSVAADPLAQFTRWLADAVDAALPEPNAMVLATATGQGPSARTVLLKAVDARGFQFFTNRGSRKARDLAAQPTAALVFPWFALHRQVIVTGSVVELSRGEAAEYFASRPRGSQLGAWASRQSEVIDGRDPLETAYREADERWPEPTAVPLPDHWGGFLVMATQVEFWKGRASRLHDRLRYVRDEPINPRVGCELDRVDRWRIERLSP